MSMNEKTTQILYAYWNAVRGERFAPRRFDIEPSRIASILPETFILERTPDEALRFRLAGTKICEMFGREFRGLDPMVLWSKDDAESMRRLLHNVTQEGSVGVVSMTAEAAHPVTVDCEMLLLPLVHSGEKINRVLGSLTVADNANWLRHLPIENLTIRTANTIWPDGRPHAVINNMARQSPFLAEPRYARLVTSQNRSFRVYEGGRSGD